MQSTRGANKPHHRWVLTGTAWTSDTACPASLAYQGVALCGGGRIALEEKQKAQCSELLALQLVALFVTRVNGRSGVVGLFKKSSKINGFGLVTSDNYPPGGEEYH